MDDPTFAQESGWWSFGDIDYTLVSASYPPNAYKQEPADFPAAWASSPSSLHPGGVQVLMGDGSVRFIKETIESLYPSEFGVWQKLATRAGGEILSADSY